MIYYSNNVAQFYNLKATFKDNGEARTHYTNDRTYYEDLVSTWGHLSDLSITTVTPTAEQQARLDTLNTLEASNKDLWQGSSSLFVEHGVILPDGDSFLVTLKDQYKESTLAFFKDSVKKVLTDVCNSKLEQLIATYPEREAATWPFQLEEAKNYLADNTYPTPFISAALSKEETVDQYAALIVANNNTWSAFAGGVVNMRREYEAAINSANSIEALAEIKEAIIKH